MYPASANTDSHPCILICRDAWTHTDQYAHAFSNSHEHPCPDSSANTDSYRHARFGAHADANPYSFTFSNSHEHPYPDSNASTDGHTGSDLNPPAYGDTLPSI